MSLACSNLWASGILLVCQNGITQEKFDQYRTAELKHGRVSQLAVIGYLAQDNFRISGYLSPIDKLKFDDITNGVAAITQVPILGWLQLIALVGFFESVVWKQIWGAYWLILRCI